MFKLGYTLIDEFVGRALLYIFLGNVEIEWMIKILDGALADNHRDKFLQEQIWIEFEDLFEVVNLFEVCETISWPLNSLSLRESHWYGRLLL